MVKKGPESVVVSSQTTSFTYDAAGIRVKTVEPSGKTTYTPFPGYEEEVNGSTTCHITYTLAGQAVAVYVTNDPVSSNNGFFYLYTAHLGSTSVLSNNSGAEVSGSRAYHLPFGSYRGTPPSQTLTDRSFTGQKENMELGLLYYNARYYAPGLGRFISADTIVPNPANPQSYNRYSYVQNNPLKFTDPTGHRECDLQNLCDAGPEGQTGPIPDWWSKRGDYDKRVYVEGYGYFDRQHLNRGYKLGLTIIADIETALAGGGGTFRVTDPSGGPYWREYSISGDLTDEQIAGVAVAIYLDYERGFEAQQPKKFGIIPVSNFSPEDLPSDYIGFWAAISGYSRDDIPAILQSLGRVEDCWCPFSWLVNKYYTSTASSAATSTGGTSVNYLFVKNHQFEPMTQVVTQPSPYLTFVEWLNVPWPEALQVPPVQSNENTWWVAQ